MYVFIFSSIFWAQTGLIEQNKFEKKYDIKYDPKIKNDFYGIMVFPFLDM